MPNIYEEKQETSLATFSREANSVSKYSSNLLLAKDSLDKSETELILFSSVAKRELGELKLSTQTISDKEFNEKARHIQELYEGLEAIYEDVKSIRVSFHKTQIKFKTKKIVSYGRLWNAYWSSSEEF